MAALATLAARASARFRVAPRRLLCSAAAAAESPPTTRQLLLHARLAAVPMVGFGFMDNIIMIQAGDFIDATLGVTLGISTLTAAAFGNVCSDSSGVLFGGFVESASERLRLEQPKLTPAQAKMAVTRRVAMFGQLIGIICGCCLGMTSLLFLDLEATERLKMAKRLDTVFEPVVRNCQTMVRAERCTLYLFDEEKRELWTRVAVAAEADEPAGGGTGGTNALGGGKSSLSIIKLSLDSKSLAAISARERILLNIPDAKADGRHDGSWDERTGFVTRSVLCMPILDEDGKLYGCLQAVNKQDDSSARGFTVDDEKLLSMVASHISIFVEVVMDGG